VATVIHEGGLDKFYQYRSQLNRRPEQLQASFTLYDREDIQQDFVDHHGDQQHTAHLLLDDITCAACVWLIEQRLQVVKGVVSVRVNASTHQCLLRWDQQYTSLSALMSILAEIGYRPQPLTYDHQEQQRKRYQRMALMRLGVAAFGMMQVGMVAIALYAGALQGMDPQWSSFFRWVSLVVATPVVLFSAQPFWSAAWKNIKQKHLTMEVPVSLAIVLAYIASVWATMTGMGEVYFDSVSMFTFFLLLGRYLEMRTRFRNHQHTHGVTRLLPLVARRVSAHDHQQVDTIVLAELKLGDLVQVVAGDTIPCDGEVIEGSSAVVEALLTGEAEPVSKQVGDTVIAGTVNTDGSLLIKATATDRQTRLSTIEKLTAFAEQDKPKIQELANTVARYFVAAVLCISAAVFTFWSVYDPEAALWITLSVLVVTCPCALSLATPTVLTATISAMRSHGLLVLKGHVIETLTHIHRVVFDKTGTLTYGKPSVVEVQCCDHGLSEENALSLAAALERGSSHPIASAFTTYAGPYIATQRDITTGAGVQGVVAIREGEQYTYRLGKPSFALGDEVALPSAGQWIALSQVASLGEQQGYTLLAWIRLSDTLRKTAVPAVTDLQKQAIAVDILSGDNASVVSDVAAQLGTNTFRAGVSPEEKLQYIRNQQKQQQTVLMVGDGMNDVPVLAGADVSVAMDSASDFACSHADAVLLNGDLTVLLKAVTLSRRCKVIMRQNITWALLYNITALPLAAAGFIPPYLAAIGMSLSSLIVVLNALRVGKPIS
jgi:Cu2+-exporting ATPase